MRVQFSGFNVEFLVLANLVLFVAKLNFPFVKTDKQIAQELNSQFLGLNYCQNDSECSRKDVNSVCRDQSCICQLNFRPDKDGICQFVANYCTVSTEIKVAY